MNLLGSCLPKRTGTRIYLPEDDEDDIVNHNYTSNSCFASCCFPFCQTRGNNRESLIRLPEGVHRQTIDDYLDPRSPVSIEALLAEQEEELDHYYGQTDDEDAYHGPAVATSKYTPLSLNLVDTLSSSFFEEEDAQFLSEHRISAILVDRPKLSGAHLFKEDNDTTTDNNKQGSMIEQDFLDEAVPITSTSTNSVSSRVFAIKIKDKDDEQPFKMVTDSLHISSSPKELKDFRPLTATNRNQRTVYPSSSLSSSAASSVSSNKAHNNESLIQTSTALDTTSLSIPAAPAASSSLSFEQNNHHHHQQRTEFPATTLTRVPYQPPPAMQVNMPAQPLHHQPAASFSSRPAPFVSSSSSSITTTTSSLPPQHHALGTGGRRPSVVAAAQNLLGDKLEDFTEKLAFIKKNIIMSLDSDDEDEQELGTNQNRASNSNMKLSQKNRQSRESSTLLDPRQRMASSIEKSWDSFLPKFNNNKKQHQQSTSLIESNNTPVLLPPRSSSMDHKQSLLLDSQRRFSNASSYNDDEQDPFDFGKIGKNVRTFGEGVMGNGLRMFNNLSTRIKNANNQHHHSDEFEAQQGYHHHHQQQQQQQQQQVELL